MTLQPDDYITLDGDISTESQFQKPLRGQVPLDSLLYIERPPLEALGYEEVMQAGALIRIRAPRQLGKTSLMVRILAVAQERGLRVIVVNLQLADASVFRDLNRFLRWFCAVVTRNLQFPNRVDQYWDDMLGNSYNCTEYFENYLLPELNDPLVLAIDELDAVFSHSNIAADFFSMLRAWYEKSRYGNGNSSMWQRLRLVVVHSTEIYTPLNLNSPLNVGLLLDLPNFTAEQVQDLVQRYGIESKDLTPRLMELLGGIPALTQSVLHHLSRGEITLDHLTPSAIAANSIFSSHLRRQLAYLQQQPHLIASLEQVIFATEPLDLNPLQAFGLQSLGLVQLKNLKAVPTCNLYRDYFMQVLPNLSSK